MSTVSHHGARCVDFLPSMSTFSNSSVLTTAAQSKIAKYDKSPFIQAELYLQMPRELINLISSYSNEILDGLYGEEAWKNWRNVDVLDNIPMAPSGHLSNRILLYIPRRIRFNDQEIDLTLKVLKVICGVGSFSHFSEKIAQQFEKHVAPGWVFIDKAVIPESRGKDRLTQQSMVKEEGYSLPRLWEAILLNLMTFDFTGERLYGDKPSTYTRCSEYVDQQFPIVVGDFGSKGLSVISNYLALPQIGAACSLR